MSNRTGPEANSSSETLNASGSDECLGLQMPIDLSKPLIALTYIYGFTAVELVGIPANVLSFLVLRRDRSYSTTRTFLMYLTVVDTLILLVYFHYYVLKTVYDVHNISVLEWVEYGDPHFYVLSNVAKFAQIWLTVIISADRYYAINNPLKAPQICTVKKARAACVIITLVSLALNIPRWFRYYRVPVQCYNRTIFKFVESPLLERYFPQYELVYESILDPLLYFYVPLIALIVLNTCLILSVRRAKALRERMSTKAQNETGITVTLIAVVTTFIVCETPTAMLFVLDLCIQVVSLGRGERAAFEHTCNAQVEDETLLCISILTVLVNSSVNFFLYVLIGKKFRGILLALICGNRYKSKHRQSGVFTTLNTSTRGNATANTTPCSGRNRAASLIDTSSASKLALNSDLDKRRRGSRLQADFDCSTFAGSSANDHATSLKS